MMIVIARLFAIFCLFIAPVARAQSVEDVISHRILTGWVQANGTVMAALELTLAQDWKTYWRAPGDAGIPPRFDLGRAQNLKSVQVHWPTPQVFWQSGMRSVGYTEHVILPLTLTPKRAGRDIRLRGAVDLGICSDICVPHRIRFDTTLPAGQAPRNPAIIAALADQPYSAQEAGLKEATCKIAPTDHGLRLTARLKMPSAGKQEEAVIEPPAPGIWVSEPVTKREGSTLIVAAEMVAPNGGAFAVDRGRVRITVLGSKHAVDIRGCTGG